MTICSVATLAYDLSIGKINQAQFWYAHQYLNKTDGYNIGNISQIDSFYLLYQGHYKCELVDQYHFKIRGGIDRYLKRIKESTNCEINLNNRQGVSNEFIKEIHEFAKVYEYSYTVDSLEIKARYQNSITVDKLRDGVRSLVSNNKKAIEHIDTLQLNSCKPNDSEQNISLPYKLKDIKALADGLTPIIFYMKVAIVSI